MKEGNAIATLFPLLRLYPWAVPLVVGVGLLASLSEGVGISLFIPFLQSLDQSGSFDAASGNLLVETLNRLFAGVPSNQRLVVIPFAIWGSIVLKNGLLYVNGLLFSWLNWRISHRLRSSVFRQLLTVEYGFLERYQTGQFLSILNNETWQTTQALATLVALIISVCTIVVFAVFLLLISWRLTLLTTGIVFLISMGLQALIRHVKQLGAEAAQANADFVSRALEGLSGMRVIRAFGRETYEQRRFEQASDQVCSTFMKMDMLTGAVNPLSEVLFAALLTGLLVVVLREQTNLPTLLTFIFMLYRLQPQVKVLDGARASLISLSASVGAVMSLLDRTDKSYIQSGHRPFWGLQQGIRFAGVGFRYPASDQPALREVSIHFAKGKTTALVGPSGAGKSTTIGLLCRFYDPTEGEIYVDGCPLRQLNLDQWRDRIAIVTQDIYIFSATVRENIAYGRLEATDAEIEAAAQLANAHEFIAQLPEGYDTWVGDRGVRLSGGQRQRIALARALIRDPEILILDEATNALDSLSETLIQEALEVISRDRTVIVIAHRLSTIEKADQIMVLESGQVIEQGTLHQLLNQKGLFSQLYTLQYGYRA